MKIERDVSLQSMNSFGLSAKANRLVAIRSVEEVKELITIGLSAPFMILGGGSNCLFIDETYPGLVLKNEIHGIERVDEKKEAVILKIGAGENWHDVVCWCVEHGYGGIENLSLIPGTMGAAPIQNIGAYGVEIKDVFHQLEAIDLQTGEVRIFDKEACQFGYRNSIFKHELKGRFLITQVYLRLSKDKHQLNTRYGAITSFLDKKGVTKPTISDISEAVIAIRQSKLPDPSTIGNAGSFFKNPEISPAQFESLQAKFPNVVHYSGTNGSVKVPAGWLIEQCGWKGKRVGNVGCYAQQALVIVNYGGATGEEIKAHALRVAESVRDKFEIPLTPEVNFI